MKTVGFKDLKIWQKSKQIAVEIYRITNDGQFQRDFGLRDQVRRAAISIPSNIAEGDERDSNKEAIHFFHIAKGSLAELRTQLEIAMEIKYLDEVTFVELDDRLMELGNMIGAIIRARRRVTKRFEVGG